MSRIKNWFKGQKRNIVGTLVFLTILAMGAGIAPTVEHGKGFVAAIKYEQMAEIVPAYAVAGEMEAQFGIYILDIEVISERYVVAWMLPPTDDSEDAAGAVYTFFALLFEYYPGYDAYYTIITETFLAKGVDGKRTVARGIAEYGMTSMAIEKMLLGGEENAAASLDALYASQAFWVHPYGQDAPYLESLLQREPGHIPPWESEEIE